MTGNILFLLLILTGTAQAQDDPENIWPKSLKGDKGEIIMYQPQIESFEGDKLESRSAVSIKLAGKEEMKFGAMWFESRLATDMETRTATLVRIKVTAANFPDTSQEDIDKLSQYLEKEIPTWDFHISLDRLVASLPDSKGSDAGFKSEAPTVYYREGPTVLVLIDGDPIMAKLGDFDLEYVANSAFFIAKDEKAGFFLRGSGMWFTSEDLGGPWKLTTDLPDEMVKVSQKIDEDEAAQAKEQAEDATSLGLEKSNDEPAPEIILSTVPAEVIVTDGKADFASVEGTQLLYLKNTENDVLMEIYSQNYFLLVSGRWYKSKYLDSDDWEFVSFEDLPADFSRIPDNSDMATVLASVPGTTESKEALLETQIPQTAEVDRKTASCTVKFDGDPKFEKCGDDIAYALNTDKPVLLIENKYYCVDNAVWFMAGAPQGPWTVATEVPAVVQDLPPECPVFNVKYVYIYDSTPEIVYTGYTSGYYGSYVYGPCVVYGTGWYYSPWYGSYYYPRPVTYGYGVHYSPYGGWGFSFGVSYGWLTIGVGWGRPPYYGCWGAGGYRYGYRRGYWHGYNRGYRHGYNRGATAGYRAGYRAGQHQNNNNIYRNRKDGVKHTGDVRRDNGKRPATADRKNNVYADRKGEVFRDNGGSWEKRDGQGWEGDRDKSNRDKDGQRDNKDQRDNKGDRSREGQKDRQANPEQRDRQGGDKDRQQKDRQQKDRQQKDNNRGGNGSQLDNNRGGGGSQLDRDRSNRNRGSQRQQQSPQRGGGARRGGAGGRRR